MNSGTFLSVRKSVQASKDKALFSLYYIKH